MGWRAESTAVQLVRCNSLRLLSPQKGNHRSLEPLYVYFFLPKDLYQVVVLQQGKVTEPCGANSVELRCTGFNNTLLLQQLPRVLIKVLLHSSHFKMWEA